MKIIKEDLLSGFVNMPHDLMQAGWPLKIDLYRYTPIMNRLELCGKRGDVLELEPFLELSMNPTVLILVKEGCLRRLRELDRQSIVPFDLDEAV